MALSTPSHVASEVLSFSGTTVSGTSVALANNTFYLLAITVKAASGSTKPTSVTGAGMTWVNVVEATSAVQNTSLWRALVTSGASSGALTFNFGVTHTEVLYTLVSVAGADTSGTNGSGAIVQTSNGNKAASTTFGNTDIPQLAAFGSVNNAVYAAASHNAVEDTSPAGGYTEIEDTFTSFGGSLSNRTQETQWAINARSPGWSAATSSTWRGVSAEIKASAGGGGGGGGGSVIFGTWAGGDDGANPPKFPGPSNDQAQLKWWAGTDTSVTWAGNTGIGRNPGMYRWRGSYGMGGNGDSIIKDVADANYWAARGATLSTNIKMTTGSGSSRTEAPFQKLLDGDFNAYLDKCAADAKKVNGPIYCEIFSECNVAKGHSAGQPAAMDGPWPTDEGGGGVSTTTSNRWRDWYCYIVNRFRVTNGVTNMTFVLSMAGTTSNVWVSTGGLTRDVDIFVAPILAKEITDGKTYIDCIGIDCYTDANLGPSTNPPARNANDLYRAGLDYAISVGKPAGIFETGCGPDSNGSGTAGTGSTTVFNNKATWYTNVGEWVTTNQANLRCIVFNICGSEKYDPTHDNNRYSFNNASWPAFIAMANIGVFTGATVNTISGTASGTSSGLGTLTAPGASAATLSGTAEGTSSGLGTLTAGTQARHRTRRPIPPP